MFNWWNSLTLSLVFDGRMYTSNHNVLSLSQWFHLKSWLFHQIWTSHFASQWANLLGHGSGTTGGDSFYPKGVWFWLGEQQQNSWEAVTKLARPWPIICSVLPGGQKSLRNHPGAAGRGHIHLRGQQDWDHDPCSLHPWFVVRQRAGWAWNRGHELRSS